MFEKINEPVSVVLSYESSGAKVMPQTISWRGRDYPVRHLGLHHTYQKGATLFHVFSIISDGCFMRLLLDSETLHWELEEIMENAM